MPGPDGRLTPALQMGMVLEQSVRQDLGLVLRSRLSQENFTRVRLSTSPRQGSKGEIFHTLARAAELLGWVSFQMAQPEILEAEPKFYTERNILPILNLVDGISELGTVADIRNSLSPAEIGSELVKMGPYFEKHARIMNSYRDPADAYASEGVYEYLHRSPQEQTEEGDRFPEPRGDQWTYEHRPTKFGTEMDALAHDPALRDANVFARLSPADQTRLLDVVQNNTRAIVDDCMSAVRRYYGEGGEAESSLPLSWQTYDAQLRRNKYTEVQYSEDSEQIASVLGQAGRMAHDYRTPMTAVRLQQQMFARRAARGGIAAEYEEATRGRVFALWGDLYKLAKARVHDLETGRFSEKIDIREVLERLEGEIREGISLQPYTSKHIVLDLGEVPDRFVGKRVFYSYGQIESLAAGLVSNHAKVLATKPDIGIGSLQVSVAAVDKDGNDWLDESQGQVYMALRADDNLGGFPADKGIAMNVVDPTTGKISGETGEIDPTSYQLGKGFTGKHGYDASEDGLELPSAGDGMVDLRQSAQRSYAGEIASYNLRQGRVDWPVRDGNGAFVIDRTPYDGARYELRIPLAR